MLVPFSATEADEVENCRLPAGGAASSSVIVIVEFEGVPSAAPPCGFDRLTPNASLPSYVLSLRIVTVKVSLRSPSANDSVLLVDV